VSPLGIAAIVIVLAALVAGCGASRAYGRGEDAARAGDWDTAVTEYTSALEADPDNAYYKIALERATLNASRIHQARARELESKDQLDAAVLEYRRAAELDPSNRLAAGRAAELDRIIRDRLEAMRPKPPIQQMREQARQIAQEPILNPASREPLRVQFVNASLRDILNFIGTQTGLNVTYDRDFQDRPYTIQLDGVTLEQALNQILMTNALFYKVMDERSVLIAPDTPQKRAQYEEQVIRTFYISNADVQELAQLISSVVRVPQMAVQPMVAVNKTANTITIRATAPVADIIERVIAQNDKPRAEIVLDVEILEVNRSRAKMIGLNLSQYALGAIFSPELAPPNQSTQPTQVTSPPPFNLNTITQGISTADFYMAIPALFVRFLETDSETKVIAKPQLRGAEGTRLTLNLGDEIPVPSTVFTPLATGGAATSPLTSFNYRPVGVNVEMTPRVTFEGDIILDLLVESSTLGRDVNIAGQNLPSFGSRKVTTRLRLREGESNLLAGLIREDDRRALHGFPGILRVPILRSLLADTDEVISQTDIVMLLTPRIVRTHELTPTDLAPIFIGTQQNIGLGGAPQLPNAAVPDAGAVPGAAQAPGAPAQPPAGTPTVPPGSSPIPGTTTAPSPAPAPQPPPGDPTPPTATAAPPAPPQSPEVIVTPPGTDFRVGAGPYMVPISISGATQLSAVTLTLSYSPGVLRVRTVQEGSFMRQGGIAVSFTQQVDAAMGRIDLSLTRTTDTTGATGSGLLAAVLFEPTAPGSATFQLSGTARMPDGTPVELRFEPVSVSVR
jgi:general secretion pathway protein D